MELMNIFAQSVDNLLKEKTDYFYNSDFVVIKGLTDSF